MFQTSAHPAPKHMCTRPCECMRAHTHTLQNMVSPLSTPFSDFPSQMTLPLPPVSGDASCPQAELFPRSQRCGWFRSPCGGLSEAGGLCSFRDIAPGLCLRSLAEEGLRGHRGCVPDRLVELSGGCRPLAWVPGPVERTCSLHSKQGATVYKSFCLLDLCLCHQLSGYRDTSAHLRGLLGA